MVSMQSRIIIPPDIKIRRMRRNIEIVKMLLVVLLTFEMLASSAQTLQFSYDQNGNRIEQLQTGTEATKPTITRSGDSLLSSWSGPNQWLLNGQPIPDTTRSLLPAVPGSYQVIASSIYNCPSDTSDPYLYKDSTDSNSLVQVFPNPVYSSFTVKYSVPGNPSLTLIMYDITGRQLMLLENVGSGQTVDMSALSKGLYIVHILSLSGTKVDFKAKILKL